MTILTESQAKTLNIPVSDVIRIETDIREPGVTRIVTKTDTIMVAVPYAELKDSLNEAWQRPPKEKRSKPKPRPVFFTNCELKSVFDGTRTMFRRLVIPQPVIITLRHDDNSPTRYDGLWERNEYNEGDNCHYIEVLDKLTLEPTEHYVSAGRSPFGEVGDKLSVREAWGWDKDPNSFGGIKPVYFIDRCHEIPHRFPTHNGTWHSAEHMLSKLARMIIEITDIKVERLQDIAAKDIIAEGFNTVSEFTRYWDREQAKLRPESEWHNNPFVWCYSFKVAEDRRKI